MSNAFKAHFQRDDDGNWLVHLVKEPRVHTFGRSFAQARSRIIDATSLWFELHPEEFEIVPEIELGSQLQKLVEDALEARREFELAAKRWSESVTAAVKASIEGGLSRREIAEILQMSHQRIQQLVSRLESGRMSKR